MINGLEITAHNRQAHVDIEKDIEKQKNGLYTFILRINNGNIVDYNVVEYRDARQYLVLKQVIIQEYTVARHIDLGDKPDPIRTDNGQRPA